MPKIEKDFEELLSLFNKHGIKFCIVGAYALAFYAIPRYTKDLDLFVKPDKENAKKILKALQEFGFHQLELSVKDLSTPGAIVQLGYEPIRVDLLTSIDGCHFTTVWKNKKRGTYGKEKIYFIGLNDLIRNKKKSGRTQDKVDLEKLSTVKNFKKNTDGSSPSQG